MRQSGSDLSWYKHLEDRYWHYQDAFVSGQSDPIMERKDWVVQKNRKQKYRVSWEEREKWKKDHQCGKRLKKNGRLPIKIEE